MNEKGAVLPSIIVFVFLLVVILLGTVTIYYDQMNQLFVTKESYTAKAMLIMTEKELVTRLDNLEMIEEGTATFQNGIVYFEQITPCHYQLKAVVDNQFTVNKQIEYVVPESIEEPQLEINSSEMIQSLKK